MRHHLNPDDCFIDTADWRNQLQKACPLTAVLVRLWPSDQWTLPGEHLVTGRVPVVSSSLPGYSWPALSSLVYLFHPLFARYHRVRARTAATVSLCRQRRVWFVRCSGVLRRKRQGYSRRNQIFVKLLCLFLLPQNEIWQVLTCFQTQSCHSARF